MSGTFLKFPKTYQVDDVYFMLIAALIKQEFTKNASYSPDFGLTRFVRDIERLGWEFSAETAIEMTPYCSTPAAHKAFISCLKNIERDVEDWGESFPSERAIELFGNRAPFFLYCSPTKLLYWLGHFVRMMEEYTNNLGIENIPKPGGPP